MPKEIKDYKIKESLSNLKQSIDHAKGLMGDIDAKFQLLVDILSEREAARAEEEETKVDKTEAAE